MAGPNTEITPEQLEERANDLSGRELRIYSHSMLFYWWPVWVVGFILALITLLDGNKVTFPESNVEVHIHPSKDLGVVFGVVLFLVILITNTTVRGLASVIVVLAAMFLTVLFAYLGWWTHILNLMPHLAGYINLGFYVSFSAALFIAWFLTVFFFDRLSYWRLQAGQLTHTVLIGGGERSFDTRGMVFEKEQQDLFRHWLLGLGSGDMHIVTTGARAKKS